MNRSTGGWDSPILREDIHHVRIPLNRWPSCMVDSEKSPLLGGSLPTFIASCWGTVLTPEIFAEQPPHIYPIVKSPGLVHPPSHDDRGMNHQVINPDSNEPRILILFWTTIG